MNIGFARETLLKTKKHPAPQNAGRGVFWLTVNIGAYLTASFKALPARNFGAFIAAI